MFTKTGLYIINYDYAQLIGRIKHYLKAGKYSYFSFNNYFLLFSPSSSPPPLSLSLCVSVCLSLYQSIFISIFYLSLSPFLFLLISSALSLSLYLHTLSHFLLIIPLSLSFYVLTLSLFLSILCPSIKQNILFRKI